MLFEKGSVQKAKTLTVEWLEKYLASYSSFISIGLPEYDDRYNFWRVPLNLHNGRDILIGQLNINENS